MLGTPISAITSSQNKGFQPIPLCSSEVRKGRDIFDYAQSLGLGTMSYELVEK